MRTLIFVYIIEEFANTYVQNAPLVRFLLIPGLGDAKNKKKR